MAEILRARIFHTVANPFLVEGALRFHEDGGLLVRDGRVGECADFGPLRAANPAAAVRDLHGGFLLPGFVDAHVHFPQVRVTGGLGMELLDWLEKRALPEESRMADLAHARRVARAFVRLLASHGTTTAMVFGAHFGGATAELFEAAAELGLRVAAGMVLSDRLLRPELHQTAEAAYRESRALIERYHGRGRLLYAVTPRFALSASEAMLEVSQTLMREFAGVRLQTHLNESPAEIAEVARLFPWAADYFAVYERFGLCGAGAVMAHSVHPTDGELERMAGSGTWVAHCPSSNSALGSGVFPMTRHLRGGVRFALGTDVGAGTGVGILKEALQAYLVRRVAADGIRLTTEQLLYLATLAGAEALGLGAEAGNFEAGKSADWVWLRAPEGSELAYSLEMARSPEEILGALIVLAGRDCVAEVAVGGEPIFTSS